jgi:hypothetical protein
LTLLRLGCHRHRLLLLLRRGWARSIGVGIGVVGSPRRALHLAQHALQLRNIRSVNRRW